jgi:hypothetical protein
LNDILFGKADDDFDLSAIDFYIYEAYIFPDGDALTILSFAAILGSYARSRKNIFVSAFESKAFAYAVGLVLV